MGASSSTEKFMKRKEGPKKGISRRGFCACRTGSEQRTDDDSCDSNSEETNKEVNPTTAPKYITQIQTTEADTPPPRQQPEDDWIEDDKECTAPITAAPERTAPQIPPAASSREQQPHEYRDDSSSSSTSDHHHHHKSRHKSQHILDHLKERIASDRFEINNLGADIRTSDSVPIESIYDGVHDGPVLGYGVGGVVRLVTHRVTGTEYAVKLLSTTAGGTTGDGGGGENLHQLREELEILIGVDHPNIVKGEGFYESMDKIFVVQELCRGGDLFDRLDAQPEEHYDEAQCGRLVKQMLSAVRYIHSKGIVHRDLKLENFLFDHGGADSELKMIDFGLSKHFDRTSTGGGGDCRLHECVGTRYTVAPEVLNGSYDERVDIWAIGVITFLLLSGQSPFGGCGDYDRSPTEVRQNILSGSYTFEPSEIWSHVSDRAKDFIASTLVVDPTRRLTAEQCQNNPWLRELDIAAVNSQERKKEGGNKLNPNVIGALRSFGKLSDVRKLLCEAIGFTLLPHQITDLRKEFAKLDVEQSGEISLQSLKKALVENAGSGALGTVTEEEVEDIFYSLRLHKEHLHIHWHEFIAAGLSQCPVEDSNLRLAFNRIDADQKGYVTFDDFNRFVMGPQAMLRRRESMRELWEKVGKQSYDSESKISFDEFKTLMKES